MQFSLASLVLVLVSSVGVAEAAPRALARAQAAPPAESGGGNASAVEQAKAHYKSGLAHYKLDEWKEAMEEFKTAYRLYPDPTFFYNIALCHKKLGENADALSFYKKYLREKPDATNRAEVERRIAELEPIVAAEAKAPKPATGTAPPPPEPPPATPPVTSTGLTPPPVTAPPPGPAIEIGAPAPPPADTGEKPIYKQWWLWAGVGAVVVAGAVTAVALSSGGSKESMPMYHPGDLGPGLIMVPSK